jgi:hypothetical protein
MECGDPDPPIPVLYAQDKCDTEPKTTGPVKAGPSNDVGNVWTHTWMATDSCNLQNTTVQTIRVLDTILPTLVNVPADITWQCGVALPTPPTVTASYRCDSFNGRLTSVEFSEKIVAGGDCGYDVIRNWTATDQGLNKNWEIQTIHVRDTVKPELHNMPPDITLNCGDPIPASPTVTARDNCDNNIELKLEGPFDKAAATMECGTILTRTWRATYRCSNMVTYVKYMENIIGTSPAPLPKNIFCFSGVNFVNVQGRALFPSNC